MLRVFFGSCENEIYNTDMFYENQYEKSWVLDDFAIKVINERRRKVITDRTEYILLAHHYLRGGANEG